VKPALNDFDKPRRTVAGDPINKPVFARDPT
jgi:hypothetical protein